MAKELISRNDYFRKISELGVKKTEEQYDILPLDLSKYPLKQKTKEIINANFMHESVDKNRNYMLSGHWMSDLTFKFADVCDFTYVGVDGYRSYAYSDEQLAVMSYCEHDIYIVLFTDKEKYEKELKETIEFYKGE